MEFLHSIAAFRIFFVLAFINLLGALLVLLSCRCITGVPYGPRLLARPWFRGFYRYHCYIWWVFWLSVVGHAVLALFFAGVPF